MKSGTGTCFTSAAETLGKTREAMINDLINGKSKYSNIFNYPAKSWADIAVIGFLVDAGSDRKSACECSELRPVLPRKVFERILAEGIIPFEAAGYAMRSLLRWASGSRSSARYKRTHLNRCCWWFPPMMHFFGPPGHDLRPHLKSWMRWKVKMARNEECGRTSYRAICSQRSGNLE